MERVPKISEAEWQIMKAVWDKSPLTSSEIIAMLANETTWSPKTVRTLIGRLVKKEALGVNSDSQPNLYFPMVSEEEYRKEETKSFLNKVYEGSLKMLVTNFIKDEKISQEEIEELKRLLDEKKS